MTEIDRCGSCGKYKKSHGYPAELCECKPTMETRDEEKKWREELYVWCERNCPKGEFHFGSLVQIVMEATQTARTMERERYARSIPNNTALITIEVRSDNKITANKKAVSLLSIESSDGRTLLLEAEACAHQVLQAITPIT